MNHFYVRYILISFIIVLFISRSYLILGKDSEAPPGYLGIGPRSIVIEWKDEWYRRMKRFQRRARTCE